MNDPKIETPTAHRLGSADAHGSGAGIEAIAALERLAGIGMSVLFAFRTTPNLR